VTTNAESMPVADTDVNMVFEFGRLNSTDSVNTTNVDQCPAPSNGCRATQHSTWRIKKRLFKAGTHN
jgi:hypothetical protein